MAKHWFYASVYANLHGQLTYVHVSCQESNFTQMLLSPFIGCCSLLFDSLSSLASLVNKALRCFIYFALFTGAIDNVEECYSFL